MVAVSCCLGVAVCLHVVYMLSKPSDDTEVRDV